MPGEDAGHHREAGPGVPLGPAGHWLQQGGRFPVSLFSGQRLLGLFTEPGFEAWVFVRFLTEFGYLNHPLFL